jgi:hypothetical protein
MHPRYYLLSGNSCIFYAQFIYRQELFQEYSSGLLFDTNRPGVVKVHLLYRMM